MHNPRESGTSTYLVDGGENFPKVVGSCEKRTNKGFSEKSGLNGILFA